MSNPGGPYWQEPQPQYQVDPITGQPAHYQPLQQGGGYQGFGMYQQPPPGPNKPNRTPWIIALVAVLVVGLGVTTTLILTDKDDAGPIAGPGKSSEQATKTTEPTKASTSTSATVRQPSTTSRASGAPRTPSSVDEITIDPVIVGWQGVWSYKENVAYDVPTEWQIDSPGVIVGFEDNTGKPTAVMHGVSTYRPEACPTVDGSYRGRIGLVTADKLDPTDAAGRGAKLFADAAALNADGTKAPVTFTEPVPTKVNQGKIEAMMATATLTVTKPGECPSPTVQFTSVAFKAGAKTALFMMYMDQGVPDALPKEIADQIISSLRPHEG
ncbi:MAG: hypothetical protein M3443_10210 [Actinomycetota bacterium]|nr:hypothetical protein [Actinomycetota bacterium]